MKRLILALTFCALSLPAAAQYDIDNDRSDEYGSNSGSFTIGPRVSNYSTDIDYAGLSIESGRQSSFGLAGELRNNHFVLDFLYDHDPEDGVSVVDILPIEFGKFSRDRAEVTIGYSIAPMFDVQGGVRVDQISLGGEALGGDLFDGQDVEHQALTAGVKFHTPDRRGAVGAYLLARGYLGTMDFGNDGFFDNNDNGEQMDSTGYRAEAGVSIPLGSSNWSLVPAVEIERIQTDDDFLNLDTNRVLLSFVYRMR
jgi:hypothetical protein